MLVCTQNIEAGKNNGSSNICNPWILGAKFYFLVDMFFNSRYVFHGIHTSYVTGRCYVTKIKKKNNDKYGVHHNIYWPFKSQRIRLSCYVKNIPNPLPVGGMFEDKNF